MNFILARQDRFTVYDLAYLARLRRWRESVAPHDFKHLDAVRRTTGGPVGDVGRLAEESRTDRGGRDRAEGLHALGAVIVEAMNGAAWNAQRLPWPNLDPFALHEKAPKTVKNVLTVLNTLMKQAVEWNVIDRQPCTIRLLPIHKGSGGFDDFEEFERLVTAAKSSAAKSYLIVLLGGEAGLRCGEIMALEWTDIDLAKRQLCVQRSDGDLGTTQRYMHLSSAALDAAIRLLDTGPSGRSFGDIG
jgi:integrase